VEDSRKTEKKNTNTPKKNQTKPKKTKKKKGGEGGSLSSVRPRTNGLGGASTRPEKGKKKGRTVV